MSVWNNKSGSSTTSWTNQDDPNTTSWSTSGGGQSFGTASQQSTIAGVFDSAAAASAAIIGGQYHLLDNVKFNMGTDKDFTFKFNSTTSGFHINGLDTTSSNYFTVTKGDSTNLLNLNSDGDLTVSGSFSSQNLHITESAELPPLPVNGDIAYYNNELYVAK